MSSVPPTHRGGRRRWYRAIFREEGATRVRHVGVEAHTRDAARDAIEDAYGVRPRAVSFLGRFGDDGPPTSMRRERVE
jgi:hypothetical protein